MSARSDVGAVLIGRNEGARLVACLESTRAGIARIVYVDSGSSDGSVAAARERGARVVELDRSVPFTAARARNAGAQALCAADPDGELRYLLFVDGDCALAPGWVDAAIGFLEAHPAAAVACGRRREIRPGASVYNRLCDMEWNTPVGRARACGGDSVMRREAFEAAGGFDPTLIAGEEPDLCFRLRQSGWEIWRLDAEMTRHDAAMTRFGQWWRRAIRSGWAFAEGAHRHGRSPEAYNMRQLRSLRLWGGAAPAAIVALALAALAAGFLGLGGLARVLGLLALGIASLYPVMAARIALDRRRRFGDPWRHAGLYGIFTMIGKPAQALGALRFARIRRAGASPSLIEYKDAPKSTS